MAIGSEPEQIAAALRVSVGMLVRRLRQTATGGELTMPESSALARLDRGGPATASALAKAEQISPQSMGATLAELERRGLIDRAADPADGRRVVLTLSSGGMQALSDRRDARVQQMARVLAEEFTASELARLQQAAPLLERLSESI